MKAVQRKKPTQIAVVLCRDIAKEAVPALKFLLLQLNTLQSTFEYEFLPDPDDDLLIRLSSGEELKRKEIDEDLDRFSQAYSDFLYRKAKDYELPVVIPGEILIVSRAKFADNYFV